jgi:hypothetical protein
LEAATAVAEPEIEEVTDLETGADHFATAWIANHLYQDLSKARSRISESIKKGQPELACSWCGTPVLLLSSTEKRFFFRHIVEDGSCPAQTRSLLSEAEIRARKYFGQRESDAHKRIKGLIEQSLDADPSFSMIAVEKTWRSARDPKARRQPDVQATSAERRFAFEVQLSTTFLDVVSGRRLFYRDEGALLVWVLGYFTPDYRRITTDDLLFPNNSNIFVVDEETTAISIARERLHLRCHYRRPVLKHGQVEEAWDECIVAFSDLTQDQDRQRLFYFDYEAAEAEIRALVERDRQASENEAKAALRDLFEIFWREKGVYCDHKPETLKTWGIIRLGFAHQGMLLPEYPDSDSNLRAGLNALYSAKAGSPVGWRFQTLAEAAHHLFEKYPRHLLAFGYALQVYDRSSQIEAQDGSGKWSRKAKAARAQLSRRDPDSLPDPAVLPILEFLFPEVGARVEAFLSKTPSFVHADD